MSKIHLLDNDTVNRIAAGEVIERPMAVVKELVDNAIDAGASMITVEIKKGGTSLIRVTDDGDGMAKEDIPQAFLRHSTSKIRSAEDLFSVTSLGFRGEALSSIAAVARVEMVTKQSGDLLGHRYQIEGGEEIAFEEVGAPDGTTFLVRELFYNTPARRKFLRSDGAEAARIIEMTERAALSHPAVAFKLFVNGTVRLQTAGNGKIKDIIYGIYGRDTAKGLLPVAYEEDGVRIHGFVGRPFIARPNRSQMNTFVNGRFVKSRLLTDAIEAAFHGRMMKGKFPFTCLYVDIAPDRIDVNIHPTKMEIKFLNEDALADVIITAIRSSFGDAVLIPEVEMTERLEDAGLNKTRTEPFEKRRRSEEGIPPRQQHFVTAKAYPKGDGVMPDKDVRDVEKAGHSSYDRRPATGYVGEQAAADVRAVVKVGHQKSEEPSRPTQVSLFDLDEEQTGLKLRIIGQAFRTYWIVEMDDTLFLVDQHAAHEKVLFERFLADFKTKKIHKQTLAVPITVTLRATEAEALARYRERFDALGFEVEHFGGNDYVLRTVPYNLYNLDHKQLFETLLSDVFIQKDTTDNDTLYIKIATMACKAAVKGNNILSEHEFLVLMQDMMRLDNPYQCPHGRPTAIRMTKRELDGKFARIV